MVNVKSNRRKLVLVIITVIAMLINMMSVWQFPKEVEAAESYSFSSSLIWGDGDVSAKFRITKDGKTMTGLCRHGGPPNSSSAKATMTKLKTTDSRYYLAYYYGYKKGWTTGAKGCDLARAFNYATYGNAYHQSASKSRSMIAKAKEYAKAHGIPSNFVAYDCNPVNGTQEFIAWYYASDGKVKIVKKSTDSSVSKTGAYSFSGIQYKIYESKSTSSKCYGTLTLSAGGTSKAIKLGPDGLSSKKYYIRESKTNGYYELNNTWYSVTVSSNKTKTVTVKDTPKYGSFTFKKVLTDDSAKGSTVKGFTFSLVNKNNSSVKYTAVSDANGTVTFNKVLIGDYILSEVLSRDQISNNYNSVTGSISVSIKAGSNSLPYSYVNKRKIEDPGLIVSKKTDDVGSVEGWKFNIKNNSTGSILSGETDSSGLLIFRDIPAGTYTVSEDMDSDQIGRYHSPEPQTVTLADDQTENVVVEFENKAILQPVKIKKTSEDGNIEGIEFEITGTKYSGTSYEREIDSIVGVTDENGYFDIGELPPGEYVVEETGFNPLYYVNQDKLSGYDNPAKEFTVTKEGVLVDGELSDTGEISFVNKPYSIHLEKTEILADGTVTDNPVKNAEYELYLIQDGNEIFVGKYVTDVEGKIDIYDVQPGDYKFYETGVPTGYVEKFVEVPSEGTEEGEDTTEVKPESVDFTLDSDGTGSVTVKDTNQQKYGTLFIKKQDTEEYPVEGAEFTVFTDQECTSVAKDKDGNDLIKSSDERGYVLFEELEWGTYYFKETKAPRGYNISTEVNKIEIGYDAETDSNVTDFEFHIENTMKLGSVELTKVDENDNVISAQAVYDLYKVGDTGSIGDSGSNSDILVRENLKTGEDNDGDGESDGVGKILVTGLEWGKYYFKEKVAPTGYNISNARVSVTVNAMSSERVQRVKAVDEILTSYIIATKKIKADDIWWDHGIPTFTFHLRGTAIDGTSVSLNDSVTFAKSYVENHTDSNGYVEISTRFNNLPVGDYTLSEGEVVRYSFKEIENGDTLINGIINGDEVDFTLSSDTDFGAATFVNEKDDWGNYSDTANVRNSENKKRLYSALRAEYNGEVLEGNMPIDDFNKYLDVYAVYDDGSSRLLESDEYVVTDLDNNVFNRTPKVRGSYTLTVTHEEDGITQTDIVIIEVEGAKLLNVTFETNGGTPLESMEVWKYDTLLEASGNNPSKYSTSKEYNNFICWCKDKECNEIFDPQNDLVLSNMTLYAKWEPKHLNEYSWSELADISASGNAADILGECFEETKEDLADGSLSTYEHTKTVVYGGKTIHAMITGFGIDTDEDGNSVGISFMSYESVGTSVINELDTNIGGWEASKIRESLNSSIDTNIIDTQLKDSLKSIKRLSGSKEADNTYSIVTTYDKISLPSQVELSGVYGYSTDGVASSELSGTEYGVLKSLRGEGSKLPLFEDSVPDGVANSEKALKRSYTYWTRSLAYGTSGFCTVDNNGGFSHTGQ